MGWLSALWKRGPTAEQRARGRRVERYLQALDAYERELADMPASAARSAAERVLAAPRFVRAVPWPAPPTPRPELAPALAELFRAVQRVEVPDTEQCADAAELAPLDWAPGYLCLGTDGEHTHLAVRPGDERIFVLTDDVPDDDRVESALPTIHHWILWVERKQAMLEEFHADGA